MDKIYEKLILFSPFLHPPFSVFALASLFHSSSPFSSPGVSLFSFFFLFLLLASFPYFPLTFTVWIFWLLLSYIIWFSRSLVLFFLIVFFSQVKGWPTNCNCTVMDQKIFTTKVFDAIIIPDDFILRMWEVLIVLFEKNKIKLVLIVLPIVSSPSPFC